MESRSSRHSCFTSQEVRDLEFVYRIFDVAGRDVIESGEVKKALRLLAFKVSNSTVQHLLQDLQLSNTPRQRNTTNFEGFLEIVAKLQRNSYDQHEEIAQAFKYLDSDGDGFISLHDLYKHAPKAGLSSSEAQAMFFEADKNGDGKINLTDFFSIMKQTNLFK